MVQKNRLQFRENQRSNENSNFALKKKTRQIDDFTNAELDTKMYHNPEWNYDPWRLVGSVMSKMTRENMIAVECPNKYEQFRDVQNDAVEDLVTHVDMITYIMPDSFGPMKNTFFKQGWRRRPRYAFKDDPNMAITDAFLSTL